MHHGCSRLLPLLLDCAASSSSWEDRRLRAHSKA
jgi:hypothetical protein